MALATLTLNIDDVTGPGKVGEILIRPVVSTYNTSAWTAAKPGRIPLQFTDPTRASSDPSYTPVYTKLDGTTYPQVTQGATYEFTVVRVNSTIVGTTFAAVIPSSSSVNFSDLTPLVPVPDPPTLTYSQTQVDTLLGGKVSATSAGRDALSLADYQKLMPWFAAAGRRRNERINVGLIGASIVEGYPVSSYDRTIGMRLKAALDAALPTAGLTGGGRGYIGIPTTPVAATGSTPLTFTNGAIDNGAFGYGAKKNCWYANAATSRFVDTLEAPVTSFDIIHMKTNIGGATAGYYKIDGGAAVTFNTFAASNTPETLHISAPANSTIEVGWNAAGYVIVTGIQEYRGDEAKGIQVHNIAHFGYTTTDWSNPASAAQVTGAQVALDLDLIVMQDLGVNDAVITGGNITAATFKTNLIAYIAQLRAATITCPILLVADYNVGYGAPTNQPWSNYVTAMQQVAAADATVAFLDHSARMPATAATDPYGLFHTDHIHGAVSGSAYQFMADTIATAILPR